MALPRYPDIDPAKTGETKRKVQFESAMNTDPFFTP